MAEKEKPSGIAGSGIFEPPNDGPAWTLERIMSREGIWDMGWPRALWALALRAALPADPVFLPVVRTGRKTPLPGPRDTTGRA